MRTGMCKFGTSCKYHHPRHGVGSSSTVALNVSGYPLRPVGYSFLSLKNLYFTHLSFILKQKQPLYSLGVMVRSAYIPPLTLYWVCLIYWNLLTQHELFFSHRVKKSVRTMWKRDNVSSASRVNFTIPSLLAWCHHHHHSRVDLCRPCRLLCTQMCNLFPLHLLNNMGFWPEIGQLQGRLFFLAHISQGLMVQCWFPLEWFLFLVGILTRYFQYAFLFHCSCWNSTSARYRHSKIYLCRNLASLFKGSFREILKRVPHILTWYQSMSPSLAPLFRLHLRGHVWILYRIDIYRQTYIHTYTHI